MDGFSVVSQSSRELIISQDGQVTMTAVHLQPFAMMLLRFASVLLPPLLVIHAQDLQHHSASTIRPHNYLDSFPSNDDYDHTILDVSAAYGSPYGGFSRHTQSRLAKLPLYLPEEIQNGSPDENDDSPLSYVMRDAQGRLFACKTYSEDELDPESLTESMFTAPRFREEPHEQEFKAVGDTNGDSVSVSSHDSSQGTAAPKTDVEAGECRPDDPSCTADAEDATLNAGSTSGSESSTKGVPDSAAPPGQASLENTAGKTIREPNPLHQIQFGAFPQASDASRVLSSNVDPSEEAVRIVEAFSALTKLKGVCAQIHLGWWSYEWCHEDRVTQFHIAIQPGGRDEPLLQRIELQDITSLGSQFTMSLDSEPTDDVIMKGRRKNWDWSDMRSGLDELAKVQYTFTEGDACPETGQPRETRVVYRCCSRSEMNRFKSGALVQGEQSQAQIAAFVVLNEDPAHVCNYEAIICTSVLCRGDAGADTRDPSTMRNAGQKGMVVRKKPRKENESIRETLERTLASSCLQHSDGGWWIYEICHGKHVRQFHESNVVDRVTGMQSRSIETQHLLGLYSSDELEGFPNADEIKFVVNATDDHGVSDKRASDQRGSGAYFAQEYRRGEVCDHTDVTDAAIKAGELGQGGVERSTTVRWFCGKRLELVQASEDSTCHYVIDVVLPDLCENPFFKAPVSKKKVVKCLPTEQSDIR